MRIAVVGAGIVGACTGWALAKRGHEVTLVDRGQPMMETSRASSKLLHGGLRYLETYQFLLVRKALQARAFWLEQVPHLCSKLQLLLPVYKDVGRSRLMLGAGIRLYDLLSLGSGFPAGRWLLPDEVAKVHPGLKKAGLVGAYAFYDAQMNDYELGRWVIERFTEVGGKLDCGRTITHLDELSDFDRVVNAAGPWAAELRATQPGSPAFTLDWVRGSHIILGRPCSAALFLQMPNEQRIFFILPWKGQTLVGTTEVRQGSPDNPGATDEEIRYLLDAHNYYVEPLASTADVVSSFCGVRPLLRSADNPSDATREWAFERTGKILHIYGGKWTTAQIQGEEAAKRIIQ